MTALEITISNRHEQRGGLTMRRPHAHLAAIALSVLAVLLAACGTADPTPTPPAAQDGSTPTAGAPMGFEAEWEALIAAAQEEGRLVVSGSGGVGEIAPVYKIWQDKFGIRVTIARGSGRANADRLLAEQGVGRFDVDVVHGGATTINTRLMPNGALVRMDPLLVHPEVIDRSLWYGGRHWYNDEEDAFMFVYAAEVAESSQLDDIWFNTNLVTFEEVASWRSEEEVLDKYGGSMIDAHVAQLSGAGGVVRVFIDPNRGPDYWEDVYSRDIFWAPEWRYMTDAISRGDFAISLAGAGGENGREMTEARQLGLPVESYETLRLENDWPLYDEESRLTPAGSGAAVAVAKNQPHPNAAKLWVNWLFSREGATVMQQTLGEGELLGGSATLRRASLRADDIPPGLTDPALRRKPGVNYNTIDMTPSAAALSADVIRLRIMIFEEATGFANHSEIPELRNSLEERAREFGLIQ